MGGLASIECLFSTPLSEALELANPSWLAIVGIEIKRLFALKEVNLATSIGLPPPRPITYPALISLKNCSCFSTSESL